VGPLAGLIAHHTSALTLVVELVLVAALVMLFGWIWLRERRRRVDRTRRIPEMRE
jgi:hypothetical protein